jgi:hypothetical protein
MVVLSCVRLFKQNLGVWIVTCSLFSSNENSSDPNIMGMVHYLQACINNTLLMVVLSCVRFFKQNLGAWLVVYTLSSNIDNSSDLDIMGRVHYLQATRVQKIYGSSNCISFYHFYL